jgi:hypothetical protein
VRRQTRRRRRFLALPLGAFDCLCGCESPFSLEGRRPLQEDDECSSPAALRSEVCRSPTLCG